MSFFSSFLRWNLLYVGFHIQISSMLKAAHVPEKKIPQWLSKCSRELKGTDQGGEGDIWYIEIIIFFSSRYLLLQYKEQRTWILFYALITYFVAWMACIWLIFHVGMYFCYMEENEAQIIYMTFALCILFISAENTGLCLCSPLYTELQWFITELLTS